jgi:hypothetical protein
LIYEKPGSAGVNAELSFENIDISSLTQGERVGVEGMLYGSVVIVSKITPMSQATTSATTTKAIGYIKNVYQKGGKYYLDIDYIESLSGIAAVRAKIEDKKCLTDSTQTSLKDLENYSSSTDVYGDFRDTKFGECVQPNVVYDRNNNPLIRIFEISDKVSISTAYIYTTTATEPELHWEIVNPNPGMNLSDFYKYFNMDKSAITYGPYNIEVKNNIVTKIDQQFRP